MKNTSSILTTIIEFDWLNIYYHKSHLSRINKQIQLCWTALIRLTLNWKLWMYFFFYSVIKKEKKKNESVLWSGISVDAGVRRAEKTASGFSLISRVFFHTRPARRSHAESKKRVIPLSQYPVEARRSRERGLERGCGNRGCGIERYGKRLG